MSHFTVLVVGENPEEQLAPYHEFECTGEDNEYIKEIDETEEARDTYLKHTTTRYRDTAGNLSEAFTPEGNYKPEFLREPTPEEEAKHGKMMGMGGGNGISWVSQDWHDGRGYRAKIVQIPEGLTKVEVPASEVETFAEFVEGWYGHKPVMVGEPIDFGKEHKYGYTLVNEAGEVVKVVDRTNPEAKWDWYQVGGRWNGFFKMKPQTVGVIGEASQVCVAFDKDYEAPGADRADICMKGDIDIAGMRDEAGEKAGTTYDAFMEITAGTPTPITWQEMQEKHRTGEFHADGDPKIDWDAARTEYHAQPMVKALHSSENRDAIWWSIEDFLCSREEYVNRARSAAITTFAVIKDGKWYERGEMGWWGVVHDEKNKDEWHAQFSLLIDSLPDKTLLTIVDCHI
jgi:hypothetical protein